MTEETNPNSASVGPDSPPPSSSRALSRLEARLAQAEAQILALQDRVAELNHAARLAKQRGLWLRVFLLLAALGAFFFIRSMKGAG